MDGSMRNRLIQLNHELAQLDITEFSPQLIDLFDELINLCSAKDVCLSKLNEMLDTDVELNVACENLRRLFALYGLYGEIRTAKICAVDRNHNFTEHFKHRKGYEELIQCEINMLQNLGVSLAKNSTDHNAKGSSLVTKIAFVGSGPIPTSSLIILNDHGPLVDIYNIDMCEEANQLASLISEQILPADLFKRMHFITQDICESPLPNEVRSILSQCQVIYLAAYVGINELEKLDILQNLVRQSNSDDLTRQTKQYFIIRTADGLYQILFPKVTPEKIGMLKDSVSGTSLFQVEKVRETLGIYGMVTIIATNIK
ncbi:unnamed protein product [Adineta ricciae]|uniref:Nicotianamine synthase n=1 Tax=Adineta ricciae TaxID=249248 RepID=A0A815A3K4_ADIRI|nr:unnamed protein product [Adineta ricciae]CAF1252165.1 unnamed protein product [Adineta ricciae]